jgi:hypothetical protein
MTRAPILPCPNGVCPKGQRTIGSGRRVSSLLKDGVLGDKKIRNVTLTVTTDKSFELGLSISSANATSALREFFIITGHF